MLSTNKFRNKEKGAALALVTLVSLVGLGLTLMFLAKSGVVKSIVKSNLDALDAQYQAENAVQRARAKINRAASSVILNGRMRFANPNAQLVANGERFDVLNNLYATDTDGDGSSLDEATDFLRHIVQAQAYSAVGVLDTSDEFSNWNAAFPTDWTVPNSDEFIEMKYTFSPIRVESQVASDPKQITFEYEYLIEARAFGRENFTRSAAQDSGVLSIVIRGAPFSSWSLFADSMLNQNGSTLYFAGGNTAAQAREIYGGPVHINQRPNFLGHPTFLGFFSSAISEAAWYYLSISGYTSCPGQCPSFSGKQGGVPTVTMPSQIFNTTRLAAGDTDSTASTNNDPPSLSEMKSFLAHHAGGDLDQSVASIPNGIYVPINNQVSKSLTGGIYVKGDATVTMDVVQGSSDFAAAAWSQISAAHQACKFQKVRIVNSSASNQTRDVLIGDEPCNVTYVFNGADYTAAAVVLQGRINGNIHVDGAISSLGGASRTRPAVATDFAITVSAQKDVYIKNDLQYEDSTYVTMDSSGVKGTSVVANPWGEVSGSGISPTAANVVAQVEDESRTILGIISTQRNVLIYTSNPYVAGTSAPDNINIHAAIYAGNSAAYSSATGLGCGADTAAKRGCGTGVFNYATAPNKGNIKLLGGISEFKDQTTASVSGSTVHGYSSVYMYDQRLLNSISPPAFPISNFPAAFGSLRSIKSFRMVQN